MIRWLSGGLDASTFRGTLMLYLKGVFATGAGTLLLMQIVDPELAISSAPIIVVCLVVLQYLAARTAARISALPSWLVGPALSFYLKPLPRRPQSIHAKLIGHLTDLIYRICARYLLDYYLDNTVLHLYRELRTKKLASLKMKQYGRSLLPRSPSLRVTARMIFSLYFIILVAATVLIFSLGFRPVTIFLATLVYSVVLFLWSLSLMRRNWLREGTPEGDEDREARDIE